VASIAVILPDRGEAYLVDATPDIRPQLHALREVGPSATGRADRKPIDGVFISHAHLGHYTGLAFLGFEAIHSREVPVYATHAMAELLRQNAPWNQLVRLKNITLQELGPGAKADLGPVSVTPQKVPHRDEYADTVGYRLRGPTKTVLYIPDTEPWSTILDGTFFSGDELPGRDLASIGHPLIVDTMDLLEERVRAGTLSVYFTHLNHSNPALDPDSEARKTIKARGFHLLEDGQTLAL
jgi:pyrroloquinoline quinone biosynthesis protein B